MKPTSRFTYAVKALVDLALHQGIGPVTVGVIAKRQRIPVRSLEQLFNRLRRKGLVQAERGPRGGYRLAQPADQLSVKSVFEALEQKPTRSSPLAGGNSDDPAKQVWRQVESAVQTTLEATTVGALAASLRETVAPPIDHRYTFYI